MTREEKILSLAPAVKYWTNKYKMRVPLHILAEDLESAAWLGAIDSVDRHNPALGSLNIYCQRKICGSIIDYLRSLDFMSRPARRKFKEMEAAAQKQSDENSANENATDKLTASLMAWKYLIDISSYDRQIVDGSALDILNNIISSVDAATLMNGCTTLTDRERTIITLYFFKEQSSKSISIMFGVNESRISQLKLEGLQKLREYAVKIFLKSRYYE